VPSPPFNIFAYRIELMKRLILVRHGQSEHHVRGLTGGWTDTPLTPFGVTQAEAAADRCKDLVSQETSISLLSSDLLRASQTAERVAKRLGLACQLDPGLREINNGMAVGLTWQEARKIELPETLPFEHWLPYPDGESIFTMTERVYKAMDQIEQLCPSTAIVVSHGIAGVALIQWWLRLDAQSRKGISFELDTASITELCVNSRRERTIVRLNETAHLSAIQ